MPSTSEPVHATPLERLEGLWRGRFAAMGCPCEILIETEDEPLARAVVALVRREAERIERTYSRYRDDSLVSAIHAARGTPFEVDVETAGDNELRIVFRSLDKALEAKKGRARWRTRPAAISLFVFRPNRQPARCGAIISETRFVFSASRNCTSALKSRRKAS